jgi:hypothetical protein
LVVACRKSQGLPMKRLHAIRMDALLDQPLLDDLYTVHDADGIAG